MNIHGALELCPEKERWIQECFKIDGGEKKAMNEYSKINNY